MVFLVKDVYGEHNSNRLSNLCPINFLTCKLKNSEIWRVTKMFRDERTNKIYEPITLFDIQRLIDLGNESLIDKLPIFKLSKIKWTNHIFVQWSLLTILQLETILGRLNPNKLIDMTAIINARLMTPADFLWSEDIMGLRLVADGANQFKGLYQSNN